MDYSNMRDLRTAYVTNMNDDLPKASKVMYPHHHLYTLARVHLVHVCMHLGLLLFWGNIDRLVLGGSCEINPSC